MADYPSNFAGILEAVAGGINSYVKTRNELAVFQQERARQEANDAAQRQFQQAQIQLEAERNAIERGRAAEEAKAGEFTRGQKVQELEDKLRQAGFTEQELRTIIEQVQNRGILSDIRSEQELLRLLQSMGGGGTVGQHGEWIPGIPPSVRDNLITSTMDQLDRLAAKKPDDAEFQNRIDQLRFSLPFAIASGTYGTPEQVQAVLSQLFPEGTPAQGGGGGQSKPSTFSRTRAGKFLGGNEPARSIFRGVLGGPVGPPVPITAPMNPLQLLQGAGEVGKYLFTPLPVENVAGASKEMKNLTQPMTPYGPEVSPELKKRMEEQRRRLANSRVNPPPR